MSPLQSILATYRATSQSEREKGTYFEELIRTYFPAVKTFADFRAFSQAGRGWRIGIWSM